MGVINAIHIQDNFSSVLSLKKKRKTYHVEYSELLEADELREYLNKKEHFYLSIEEDEIVDFKVTISSLIKNDNIIRSTILHKLKETLNNNSILFNYTKISYDQHDETNTYQVDGIYENHYIKTLKSVGEYKYIKSATANRFSLFALTKECIKQKSYFSVYTQGNKVIVLAIHNNQLIFSRNSTVLVDSLNDRQMAIVDEINRTIAYIHQQYRDIKFNMIVMSGSMSIDDIVPEHLFMLTQLPITVLYPNSFISGLPNEKAQHYILALGAIFTPKELLFLPIEIMQARSYSLVQQIMLSVCILFLAFSFYIAFESLSRYNDSLDEYENIKNRLIRVVRNTDTYSEADLQKSWNHLQIAEKYLKDNPLDLIIDLKPLIQLQKPTDITWELVNSIPKAQVNFTKQFDSLDALHQFKIYFNKTFNEINSSIKMQITDKTDYKKMFFHTLIEIKKEKKKVIHSRRRRRR